MRKWTTVTLLSVVASCTAISNQPWLGARPGMTPTQPTLYTVQFEVVCDRCNVRYGKEGNLYSGTSNGGWTGSTFLGALTPGRSVRVVLEADPIGDCAVLSARISVNGEKLASVGEKKPGKAVTLRATVIGR